MKTLCLSSSANPGILAPGLLGPGLLAPLGVREVDRNTHINPAVQGSGLVREKRNRKTVKLFLDIKVRLGLFSVVEDVFRSFT